MEIFYMLLCAIFIGFYNSFRKLSLKKSVDSVILVVFTTTAFLLSLLWIPFGIMIDIKYILVLALKGFAIAFSWYILLKVLKNADVSLVAITNAIAAVLSFMLAIALFKENVGHLQVIGSILVVLGVVFINMLNKNSNAKSGIIQTILLLVVAIISALGSVVDKYTTTHLTTFQVQFWFLLFVAISSWIFFAFECLRKKQFLIKKSDLKNFWMYLVGLCIFLGDLMMFIAYKVPNSKMSTISILTNLKVVVTVIMGVIIFKEKNVFKKISLSCLVMIGTILISIG